MAKKTDIRKQIIEAALATAAERDWRDDSMADIAEKAGIGIGEVY
jgi:AcrR family transcriptional regulator